jgi:hypothetical protein
VKLTFSLFLFTLVASTSFAQDNIDIITVSGRYGFPQSYKDTYQGKGTVVGGLFNVTAPIKLNKAKTTYWYNDLLYSPISVFNDETMPADIANPIHIHGFILRTGLMQKFNNGTALHLHFMPRFMTDFEAVNSKNWQFGGIALYEKRYHEKLMMRFGLMYNLERFGPLLTPLVHIDWKLANKWSIVGMVPIFLKINYHANENLTMGFSHFGLTTTYRLGNPAYVDDYIERSSIDEALFIRQRIVGNIHIEGRIGYALARKYNQYTEDQKLDLRIVLINFGDDRIQKNTSINDGLFAHLRLVYNVSLIEKEKLEGDY